MSNYRVEINELLFVKAVESVKHCVSKNDNRKALEYIKLKISKGKLTAYACDGYRAARTTIPLSQYAESEFECYIKPIKVKPSKSGANVVVIEYENNIVAVEIITEYGKIKYCFEQHEHKAIDIDKVYQDANLYDRKTGFNPNYVKQAINALSQITSKYSKCVVLETQDKAYAPFIIRAKNKDLDCISEQLILPMRLNEEEKNNE